MSLPINSDYSGSDTDENLSSDELIHIVRSAGNTGAHQPKCGSYDHDPLPLASKIRESRLGNGIPVSLINARDIGAL